MGRLLGVGTRVAANMLRERAAQSAAASPQQGAPPPGYSQQNRPAVTVPGNHTLSESNGTHTGIPSAENLRTTSRNAARGARGFGKALWNPFAHATSMLWLEVTGLFFGVFTLSFSASAWKFHHSWLTGSNHQKFLIYAACAMIFFYFTVSSFARARRKSRSKAGSR